MQIGIEILAHKKYKQQEFLFLIAFAIRENLSRKFLQIL